MGVLAVAGQKLTASFLNQYYSFADTTATTVTQATQQPLTTSYSIPASEPIVGSSYEIAFGGNGVWGATQQGLTFTVAVGGTSVLGNVVLGPQGFAANAAFKFAGFARIVWNTVGVSGNFFATLMINITQTANNIAPPGTYTQGNFQAAATYGIADATTVASAATDTTSALAYILKCAWQATTGAPTLTNRQTRWAKIA